MDSINFPESNVSLGESQPEYQTLHALYQPELYGQPMTACFGLTDEEIDEIVKTRKIWHRQMTFGNPFQPVALSTQKLF